MNLLQLRTQFRSESGRFDLVNADFSDNGADFYINAGQRYLDRLINTPKSVGRVFRELPVGAYHAIFPYCRAIKEVWVASGTDDERWQLEKKSIQDIRAEYTGSWTGLDTGDPLYYCPAVLRAVPETDRTPVGSLDAFIGFADVMFGEHYSYNGVLIVPPPDQILHVEIWGLFYSPSLDQDAHKSYWSELHPEVLLMAAYRQLEVVNRNTQGVNDWKNSINETLFGVGKDVVEEDIAEVSQMEG